MAKSESNARKMTHAHSGTGRAGEGEMMPLSAADLVP